MEEYLVEGYFQSLAPKWDFICEGTKVRAVPRQ